MQIAIDKIRIEGRLRQVSIEHVIVLAESMKEVGLLQPIVVTTSDGGYRLLAGNHRLSAAHRLGWEVIEAEVRDNIDDDLAKMAEIDENLCRHELNPLDRACFLAERQWIYERLHPNSGKGKYNRNNKKGITDTVSVMPFSEDAAKKTGLDERTIRRSTHIANKLGQELIARLQAIRVFKQSELLRLVKLEVDQREQAVALLEAGQPFQLAIDQVIGTVNQEELPQFKLSIAIAQIEKILSPFSAGERVKILKRITASMKVNMDQMDQDDGNESE